MPEDAGPNWVAFVTSVAAMLVINFFFLPPTGTFAIADPHNWVALFVFLAVSLVASNLSAAARARTQEAVARRDELARLFDLSRDVLVLNAGRDAIATLAGSIARRFDLEYVAIALPQDAEWQIFGQTARTRWELVWRGSTLDRFLSAVPDAAVQVVPLTEGAVT